ncbi:MAG: nucleotidyltransferase family protein [Telluria sp.]
MAVPLAVQAFRQPQRMSAFSLAEWEMLLRQAASANLTAALYYLAEQHDQLDGIPARVREHLAWAQVQGERHRQGVRFEVRQIRLALAELDVPLILLKGAAYTMSGLPPAPGRLFSDIDILVPKERLDDAESALMLHGWASTHLDAYDQRYYREWLHDLPHMQHVMRKRVMDVHLGILPDTS